MRARGALGRAALLLVAALAAAAPASASRPGGGGGGPAALGHATRPPLVALPTPTPAGTGTSTTKRGIGVYGDTPGSPALRAQLPLAAELVGEEGYVTLFYVIEDLVGSTRQQGRQQEGQQEGPRTSKSLAAFCAALQQAYSLRLRPIVRLGWLHAARDAADAGSNRTRYTGLAARVANVSAALPLPPAGRPPLLLHVGNELNACNEWRCSAGSEGAGGTLSLAARAAEVAGFMADTLGALRALPAAQGGRLLLAHASVASWELERCLCDGSSTASGAGSNGTTFLRLLQDQTPGLYADVDWYSSHSYPFSNSDFGTDKATNGLTFYREELRAIGRSVPVALTETGWSRNGTNNKVSAAAQANWTALAAEKYWAPDPDVLAVTPFLLVGKFWERKGWTFVECSGGDEAGRAGADGRMEGSQCAEPLEQWPIFSAWRDARL